ncbi:MAG: tetratricopeptide repeat protein [Candidatus Hodarchaeales archaeon]|jgi:tetratricopeptide (TPR) repeat protein
MTSLSIIKNLYKKGNYEEAMQKINKLPEDDHLEGVILKSRIFEKQGKYKEALNGAKEAIALSRVVKNKELEFDAIIAQAYSLMRLGKFEECLLVLDMGNQLKSSIVEKIGVFSRPSEAWFFNIKGVISRNKGELDLALIFFQKSLELSIRFDNKQDIASLYSNIAGIFYNKSDLDKALEYSLKGLALRETIGNKKDLAISYNNIGILFWTLGELDRALDFCYKGLAIREALGNKQDIASSFTNIGLILTNKGELDKALEFHQNSLSFREEGGNKKEIVFSYNSIGLIYSNKGELEQAMNYYRKGLTVSKELNLRKEMAASFQCIGEIYYNQGALVDAEENLKNALILFENLKDDVDLSQTIFDLILIALSKQDELRTKQLFARLEEIESRQENKTVSLRYKLTKALILKQEKRMRQKMKGEKLLTEIVEDEEIVDFSLTILAMQHLCELMLEELQLYGEKEVLEEAKNIITRLYEIGQEQHSYPLIINSLILQARFTLIEGDIHKAINLLDQADSLSDEKGLIKLKNTVSKEIINLENQLDQWKSLVKRNAPMYERINQSRLYDYIKEAQKMTKMMK